MLFTQYTVQHYVPMNKHDGKRCDSVKSALYMFCWSSLELKYRQHVIKGDPKIKIKTPDDTVRKYMHSLLMDANRWGTQNVKNVLVVSSELGFFFLFIIRNTTQSLQLWTLLIHFFFGDKIPITWIFLCSLHGTQEAKNPQNKQAQLLLCQKNNNK